LLEKEPRVPLNSVQGLRGTQNDEMPKQVRHDLSSVLLKMRERVEGDDKPSSVIPVPLFSRDREDGHLSRTLIAQGLKRPHPSRLCSVLRNKFEWAFLISPSLAGRNGTYLVLLRVGFTKLFRSLGILVSSYLAFSPLPCGIGLAVIPQGGIFSVALSLPPNPVFQYSETVRITDHPALWSSDFPPLLISRSA
jgi:hypothetical protein